MGVHGGDERRIAERLVVEAKLVIGRAAPAQEIGGLAPISASTDLIAATLGGVFT